VLLLDAKGALQEVDALRGRQTAAEDALALHTLMPHDDDIGCRIGRAPTH
jgi:hypothetical protein